LQIKHFDMPGFHGQGLTFVPKPGEINGQHQADKRLQAVAVIQGVAGLGQGTKKIASDKNDPE
jgi:quercetin dioxygenase-like cupin family protein